MKLNNEYFIEFDPMNVVLYKAGEKGAETKNPGEKTKRVIGYFPTFKDLLNRLIHDKILNDNDCSDLKEVIAKIEEFKKDILSQIELIKGEIK